MLSDLFPILNTAFSNYSYSNEPENDRHVEKCIGSAKYFDRYFTYAVIGGDISDIEFDEFLQNISVNTMDDISKKLRDIIERPNAGNVIQKPRSRETLYKWEEAMLPIKTVCCVSTLLPSEGSMMGFGFETPNGQVAIFIYQLFKNIQSSGKFSFAEETVI